MITISKAGLLTTVQDLGRFGYQKYGVITSGAMDPFAHRLANILVGNEENLATLEITIVGPTIHFHRDSLIAICGADLSPTINGEQISLWRPIFVRKDSELRFGSCKKGSRSYLSVAGGFSAPTVMNSKSTYLRAKIGGYCGRKLETGDQLLYDPPSVLSKIISQSLSLQSSLPYAGAKWNIENKIYPFLNKFNKVRVMKGRHYQLFTKESQEKFLREPFEVTIHSDRMGYRLQGVKLVLEKPYEMISEAVNHGTIQVPSDGNPIVLLADRQTTGGYPKIAHVASADLSLLAQAKPGDRLHFTEISHTSAQRLLLERERQLRLLKRAIHLKYC